MLANATATTYLDAQMPDAMILCGVKAGKGNVFRGSVSTTPRKFDVLDATIFTVNTTSSMLLIAPPAGGMG